MEGRSTLTAQPRELLGTRLRLVEAQLGQRRRALLGGGLGIRGRHRARILARRAARGDAKQILEARLHARAVRGQVALHRLGGRIAGAARQPLQLPRVLRQRVGLALGHHLDAVLQAPQRHVGLGQLVPVAAGEQARVEQALQRLQRAADAQVRVAAGVQELQRLHEELDLADAAAAQLQIHAGRARGFLLRARLEQPHLVHGLQVEVLAEDERGKPPQGFLARREVARDRPRLEQREALPGCPVALVVELQAADGVDDGAAAALRPQIEIHAEDESAFRRHAGRAHRGRHRFGEPGIEGEVVDGVGSLRPAVLVVDVDHVGVGREVQLLPAELAHAEHAEARGPPGAAPGRRSVDRAEAPVVEADGGLERPGGKPREIERDFRD